MLKQLKAKLVPAEASSAASRAEPTPEERRKLVETIAGSSTFRRADRLRHLLLFLEGAPDAHNLAEVDIATAVFGRGRDYAPSEDSIVRVTMRQLRFKLNEYFENEGRSEPWVVHIPKGEYALVYAKPERARESALQESGGLRRAFVLWALPAALVVSVALNLWLALRSAPGGQKTLLASVLRLNGPLTVVASDGALPLLRRVIPNPIDAARHDPKTLGYQLRELGNAGVPSHMASWYQNDPSVPFAHANAAALILRSRSRPDEQTVLRHAPSLHVRDFHSGDLVVIGSEWTNVWAGLFENRLNFRFEVKPGSAASFINLRPEPGEPALFRGEKPAHNWGKTYSRVAVLPNLSNTGVVVLLAGLDMYGTQAAAEFLTSDRGQSVYQTFLRQGGLSPARHFEILLAITAQDGVPTKTEMIGWRELRQ